MGPVDSSATVDNPGDQDVEADSALTAPNVTALTIDATSGSDMTMISVTVCVPGTSTCQTIPHIQVDTASTGLRIYAAALHVALPEETDASGHQIGDCAWTFWGYMHTADVRLGGLTATRVPIQVLEVNDPKNPGCGADDYSPAFNGRIGVSPSLRDTMPGGYHSCDASGCRLADIDSSLQAPNPIALLPTDNNGCVVQLPNVPSQGSKAVAGKLIFGVGTRANNQPPDDLLSIALDETWGQFKVESQGHVYESAFDTGTWSLNVPFLSSDLCSKDSVYLCPSSPLHIEVNILNPAGDVIYLTSMRIADYNSFPAENMALNDLGTDWPGSTQLMFGSPYFLGRSIFYAFDGRSTTSVLGNGPWVGIEPTVQPSQRYRIQNVSSSLALDVDTLDASGNYSGQQWKIQTLPGGFFRLTNTFKGDGQALDTRNDGVYEPMMAPVGPTTGQYWRITPVSDGHYRLTNKFRGVGQSLEAEADGSMHMAPNKSSAAQYWSITPF
jgi:hypothetical protein